VSKSYHIPGISATDFSGIKDITYSITGATTRSGVGADPSGSFNVGTSTITWVVRDNADNSATCSTVVRVDYPLSVTIPNVYPLPFFGNVNTIYTDFGPSCTILAASASGGTRLPGNKYFYAWSTGATTAFISICPNAVGKHIYTVTVTDSLGCTAVASITINVVDARCGAHNNQFMVCWFGKYQTCYSQRQAISALLLGAKLGSCPQPAALETTQTSGVSAPVDITGDIQLFPNPNRGIFEVRLKPVGPAEIRVSDLSGKIVLRKLSTVLNKATSVHISMGNVSDGVYILQVISKNMVQTSRFVVQR
jgi:hypothetical protein